MATPELPLGYQCEFVDIIPDELLCKKCTLVARRIATTDCCGESFCQACVADTNLPCPSCGVSNFSSFELVKYGKKISSLKVYCDMKERGCTWSGPLDHLDTHLDPHLDNCQYVDMKCPLNCLQPIPKNKLKQHLAQECTRRPFVCQHCGFKATYEEVVNKHLPECKYVPLQCPNMCGVSCERELMEDHMKICRLEEVECEFSNVGCDGWFIREDQEEHSRQNSHKHLALTASLAVMTKAELMQKILEQHKKHSKQEEKLTKTLEEQEKKLEEQGRELRIIQMKLEEQEKNHKDQEEKLLEQKKMINLVEKQERKTEYDLAEQEQKVREQGQKIGEQDKKLDEQVKLLAKIVEEYDVKLKTLEQSLQDVAASSDKGLYNCAQMFRLNRIFEMKRFSVEKKKDEVGDWKSPAMYTHVYGYKFCIGVDANGIGNGRGKSIAVSIWSLPGEFDDKLKWPAQARFYLELINQKGGENIKSFYNDSKTWVRPGIHGVKIGSLFSTKLDNGRFVFLPHSQLNEFLIHDSLHFFLSSIDIL